MPVTMKFPANCGGISHGGKAYSPTKKGLAKFPDDAVRELLDFGFTVAPPEDSMDEDASAAYLQAAQLQDVVTAGAAEKADLDEAEKQGEANAKAISDKFEGV